MNRINWVSRYSDTEELDKFGRWARIGYLPQKDGDGFNQIQIAWVSKVEENYFLNLYIGIHGNRKFDTLQEAKNFCEVYLEDFKNDYLF